jgi:hypothetical protein
MKRAAVVVLLVAVAGLAVLVIRGGQFGIRPFTPAASSASNSDDARMVDSRIAPAGPALPSGLNRMAWTLAPFHGAGSRPQVISKRRIAEVLDDWTYPGAEIIATEFTGAGVSGQKAKTERQYSRILITSAQPADVWRFYQSLAGGAPGAMNPAQQATAGPPLGNNPAASGGMPSSVAGIYVTRYSKATKDYLVSAIVFHQDGTNRTQITLLLDPREKKPAS